MITSYVGWALLTVALIASLTPAVTLIFKGEKEEGRVVKFLTMLIVFPLLGFVLWGLGLLVGWFGKTMTTPLFDIISLLS